MPRHVIVGTAGHIDHGKSSLVKRLTGIDTDRLPEEKSRGISIDLGFAHWEADEFQFGVVDVPGHERFVKNMVAGATGVDLALLVVAADDSVMPQTREHLEIMDLLGVAAGAVAITKIDLVEQSMLALVEDDVREHLRGTFLEGCPIVPVSSQTGAGIDRLKEVLVDIARNHHWPERGELFRMPIDRVFSLAGRGTIVTGTVMSGEVHPGDMVELLPERRDVRVRSVQSHGQSVEEGASRQRTAINLAGLKTEELRRGQELATAGYLQPSRRLLARVKCLSRSPIPIRDRTMLSLHLGTTEVAARLITRGAVFEPGQGGYAELRLAEPVVTAWGQHFILRRPSPALTVAGGVILDPGIEPRRRITDLSRVGATLDAADELVRLSSFLAETDSVDTSPLRPAWKTGIAPSRYAPLLQTLEAQHELIRLGGRESSRLLHKQRLGRLADAVMKRVRRVLKEHQPRRSLPRPVLFDACRNLMPPDLLDAVFAHLLRAKQLAIVGENLGPADVQVQLSKNQLAIRAKLLDAITNGQLMPPTAKELSAALGQRPDTITTLCAVSVEEGLLVPVAPDLWFTPAAIEQARTICAATLNTSGAATMSQLREAWGVSRKYSVPLCEYFDAQQFTIRDGDVRRAGPKVSTR